MSDGELFQAVHRFEARKSAADAQEGNPRSVHDQSLKVILSGLDLDMGEVAEMGLLIIRSAIRQMEGGIPPDSIIGGTWLDGLATGLLLAEQRAKTP